MLRLSNIREQQSNQAILIADTNRGPRLDKPQNL